jgi:hypothetical protein
MSAYYIRWTKNIWRFIAVSFLGKAAYFSMLQIARQSEKSFNKDTSDAFNVNMNVLMNIINKNKDTEFGRVHGFSDIHNAANYKMRVPLRTYEDFEKYILRMCRGEKNILAAEDIEYFGMSSGTTGNQKYIPFTKTGRRTASSYMGLIPQRILYKNFKDKWSYGRGLSLSDMTISGYTEGGIRINSATSGGMRSIKRLIPLIWTTPVEVMSMGKNVETLYLHLLFALRESSLTYLSGIFISSILDLFRYLEVHWRELVEDIKRGSINRRIEMDPALRKNLLKKLSPNAARADFLDREFRKGFKGVARRIWPKLIYIASVSGANFSIYDDKVSWYTDNLPIYSSAYAASESVIGINTHIDKYSYVIIPKTSFFEFISAENMYEKQPETYNINELKVGREYEIVLTNLSGLYRYRLGDVVKVVDFYNNSPEIQFMYRRNQLLNMVSEKTTEDHALHALRNTFTRLGGSFSDYTVIGDNSVSPGKYIFFVEAKDIPNRIFKDLSKILDEELCKANIAYGRQRHNKKLGRAELRLVSSGTFDLLKEQIIEKGASKSQVKIPRVLKDTNMVDLVMKRSGEYTYSSLIS